MFEWWSLFFFVVCERERERERMKMFVSPLFYRTTNILLTSKCVALFFVGVYVWCVDGILTV